jgi:3-deoxy-manno-octulosonate cytidylyltransferase (CMP-KDO synthetase)
MSMIIFKNAHSMYEDTIVIIPSRLGSARLKEKPLKKIGDKTMIEHVLSNVAGAGIPSYVATDSELIAEVVQRAGGKVIMTDPSCQSGTDRVYQAMQKIDAIDKVKYVINLQGDMPFVNPKILVSVIGMLRNSDYKIVTPVVKISPKIAASDSNVKVVLDSNHRALYFSRSLIPHGQNKDYWGHIGIYGFHKDVLTKFVSLEQSELEKAERLEQLRAIENGIDIGVCYASDYPISVDTQEDLDKAIVEYNSKIRAIA